MAMLEDLIGQYGYIALFFLLAVGIVGLPVPDELLMTFVGYLTSIGTLNYYLSVVVSFLGAMSGMIVSYLLGRKVGKPLLWRYGKWIKLTPDKLDRVETWFNRYGPWTVSFGYFIPGIRHLTCYLSGTIGMRARKYLLFAGMGALFWCVLFITLGYMLGYGIEAVTEDPIMPPDVPLP
ncbi:putative membrane protein YbfM [Paenibacillus sp. J31TS4]|uniref:DedA family protein n=1 Tax=Paenibacillus sp. J31TS4 TaxID=2807195 RepID=UPI001B1D2BDB|nr:DedA family protein [Paenibacillus sp. J31TS4]GIP40180.1 putative membrane protein YbfM [Paenibacillus sp. J31TS4]